HIKVKKTIYLDAPNVQNQFDRAGVGLVEQKLKCVPEPISMVSMGIGVAALVARKRKGSR
ncbi:MAG: PEP-CTERM sorting domain-containing protein, partial [Chthonomonas sp.]|nr:PEP-CTERM sorting domain-containing protein [Chthonomonas sp.]